MPKEIAYQQTPWSLKDLFPAPDSPELEAAFKQLEKDVADFEKFRPELTDKITPEAFLKIVKAIEVNTKLAYRIFNFAQLGFSANTGDQVYQALVARVDQFLADMSNRTLFFELWWKALDDKIAAALLKDSGDYRYFLEAMRHFKPHTLSEPEEKILNIKNVTGFNALNTLYNSITNRYTFKLAVKGETKEMTRGELMVLVRDADPDLRKRAYQEMYRVYVNDAPILGQIYQTIARDWHNENVSLRSYKTPVSTRNLVNDIPDPVVDTLMDVCQKNSAVFQRFFQLKAKWVKMDRLRRYDLYAPVAKSDKTFSFQQSAGIVFDTFQEFDPRFAELAERIFKTDHCDSEIRKGKTGGAFCATVGPDLPPWVLLNFNGRTDDVSTMAHELGHAIHSQLADKHSALTQHACLPLAETASTFSEMLLVDKLLAIEPDPDVRRDILFSQVDDAYATIQRQAFFALFERKGHDMVMKGALVDDMAAAYMENLKTQFGDAVDVSDEFKWEWVCVPHFFNVPFYVYAYTFGQLLVLSLYKQFKQEGEAFKPRLIKILSTGGSQAPIEILKDAGIDVSKPAFWQGGYDVVSGLIKQLEDIPVK